tara:strand:+ start:630 stop:1613 length:984 start_codon:yes stop_codon:yes gene_type:complete
MRLQTVIQAVRDKVNDPDEKYWSDVEIVRWISHHARQLFRAKAQADRSYGRVQHQMLASDEDRIQANILEEMQRYHFPSWVYKIYGVRDLSAGTGKQGALIDYVEHPRDTHKGWFLSGDRTIDLSKFDAAIDIEIDCAKLPPVLHYGTIDSPSTARNELRFDSSPVDGATTPNAFELSWEKDAYVGLEVEITSGSTETTNRRGFVTTIVSHDQVYDNDLATPAWVTRCTVFPKWPTVPQVGDTYELHVPLDESNYEYVASRVARSLFHKTRNIDGVAVVESVMAEGHDAYLAGLRPRQEQVPGFLVDPDSAGYGGFNPDKDYSDEGF